MTDLLLVALAGFLASIVDGALGMGFGPTSASLLLSTGLSPAATSTTVNLAKVATGLVAAISHWRFENIDRRLVVRLALPGAAGALLGATILATVDGDAIRPLLAVLLVLVGARILLRFSRPLPVAAAPRPEAADSGPEPHEPAVVVADLDVPGASIVGAAGGVTNGLVGAWGPVVTPYLLHRGLPPRFAVGSVNTAEVAVAVVSAGSLLSSLGGDGIEIPVVAAMLAGGMIAAPMAAYVVRYFPARLMGLAVAGLLLVTQVRELTRSGYLPFPALACYVAIAALLAAAGLRPRLDRRRHVAGPRSMPETLDAVPASES